MRTETGTFLTISRNKPAVVLLVALALCVAPPLLATDVSGWINEDTTWGPDGNPWRVVNDVTVAPGVTLTITSGTLVQAYFYPNYGMLKIRGSLNATGAQISGKLGFLIEADAETVLLDDCVLAIVNAVGGNVEVRDSDVYGTHIESEYVVFVRNDFFKVAGSNVGHSVGTSVGPFDLDPLFAGNHFHSDADLQLYGGESRITNNEFDEARIVIGYGASPKILGNTFDGDTTAIYSAGHLAPLIKFNTFKNQISYGVQNTTGSPLDATLNYWGDPSGPAHPSNPGGSGVPVSNNVIFAPWLGDPFEGGEPIAEFSWLPAPPTAGVPVQFTDESTGPPALWNWDFNGDGVWDSEEQNPEHIFAAPGPYQVTLEVINPYGADRITKTIDVAPVAGVPFVSSVSREFPGFFLEGTNIANTFDAAVDWQGTPGTVSFSVNGGPPSVEPGTATGAAHSFDMGADFAPSWQGSVVTITPTNNEGTTGAPWSEYVYVFAYPSWLELAINSQYGHISITADEDEVVADIEVDVPQPHLGQTITLPDYVPYIAGRLGIEETYATVKGRVSSLGFGSLGLAGATGFSIADQTVTGRVAGSGEFRLVPPAGLELERTSFTLGLRGDIRRTMGVFDAIPALAGFSGLPGISWFNKAAHFEGVVSPSLEIALAFAQQDGELVFDDGTGTAGMDLRVALVVDIVKDTFSASGWIAGGGSFTLGMPEPLLRRLDVHVEAGVDYEVQALIFMASGEARCRAWCEWTPGTGVQCPTPDCSVSGGRSNTFEVGEIVRPYERWGRYADFSYEPHVREANSRTPASVSEADLVTNVFPGASPFLLEAGSGSLLLWEHQDVNDPVLQSTEISWSFDDGGGWSTPALVADDSQVELAPRAAIDDTGRVVAVWTRIKDPAFTIPINDVGDLPLFESQLEIVSATFDPATTTWGAIATLTNDDAYDGGLRLSASPAGELMLTWLANDDGELWPTDTSPARLMASFWDSTTGEWSVPAAITTGLAWVSTQEAAYPGPGAFVLIQRDPDPDVENDGVLELYTWDGAVWSTVSTFAAGGVENRLPTVCRDAAGEGHVVWVRDGDLVHATLSDPTPLMVRAGSASMSFADATLLVNAAGNLTLLWEENLSNGPADLVARIYDPAAGIWSEDRRLTAEEEIEHRDLKGYYGSDGILHAAYLASHITRTTRDVDVDGTIYTFTNIPVFDSTDLRLFEHSLIVDLAVVDGDLEVVPATPAEGDSVTAALAVHNAGDFSVPGFVVDLYAGEPATGGTLVGTTTVPGPFAAGDIANLDFAFTMPAGGGTIVAVIDAADEVTELLEDNNEARHYVDNRAPVAGVWASSTSATSAPLTVDFHGTLSYDLDGDALIYAWTFGDGEPGQSGETCPHTFSTTGVFPVTLAVTDEHGAVGTASVVISVGSAPDAPTTLSVVATGGRWVELGWSDSSADEDGFSIFRSTSGGPFEEVGSVPVDVTGYTDTNLEPETEYSYQVVAINAFGSSQPSNTVIATTGSAEIFSNGFESGDTSVWSGTVQ